MASCARLHLPDCCKLHAEFPKVKVERCAPAFLQLLRTSQHLVAAPRSGGLGDRLMTRADISNIRTDSTGILGCANAHGSRVCLINRL